MRHTIQGLVAATLLLGLVADARAGVLPQRRGNRFAMPAKPPTVNSSPEIDSLNQALKALGATDHGYSGHRERAIEHIGTAIRFLEDPKAQGKSNGAVQKAATGKAPATTKTAANPDAASDESLRKAKKHLFTVHHKLAQHTASRGQIRADAQVRLAIDEIVAGLNLKPDAKSAGDTAGFAPKDIPTKGPDRPTK